MKTDYHSKANEILSSLDNIQRAEAPDFFYTRLRARMERENEAVMKRPWYLSPAFAIAMLLLVLFTNAYFLLNRSSHTESVVVNTTDTMQSIAAEYNLNDNSLYDLNQDK
jgi:hypothetical protein